MTAKTRLVGLKRGLSFQRMMNLPPMAITAAKVSTARSLGEAAGRGTGQRSAGCGDRRKRTGSYVHQFRLSAFSRHLVSKRAIGPYSRYGARRGIHSEGSETNSAGLEPSETGEINRGCVGVAKENRVSDGISGGPLSKRSLRCWGRLNLSWLATPERIIENRPGGRGRYK